MGCHGGVLDHFSWTNARVSRIELSLWKMMSSIILSPEHHQNNKWSKLLGKTQIWPEKAYPRMVLNCPSFYCGVVIPHFVLGSHLILRRNMSFLSLFVVLKSRDASFKGYFDKNIFWSNSNMQSLILNIKSVLIAEMTWCLKMTWGDKTILSSYLLKLNHASYN